MDNPPRSDSTVQLFLRDSELDHEIRVWEATRNFEGAIPGLDFHRACSTASRLMTNAEFSGTNWLRRSPPPRK